MKTKQTMFAYVVASLLFAGTANSFAADPAQTYSGTLNGGQFFCAGTPVQTPIISGFWTVSIDPKHRPRSRSTSFTTADIIWPLVTTP